MEVRAAYTGAMHLDQDVVDSDLRFGDLFQPKAGLAILFYQRFHTSLKADFAPKSKGKFWRFCLAAGGTLGLRLLSKPPVAAMAGLQPVAATQVDFSPAAFKSASPVRVDDRL
jgi:hypothetical protein